MICYRQLTTYLPTYLDHGAHWQVEYWPTRQQSSPTGFAWCTIHPTSKRVDVILVREDGYENPGVIDRLIDACRMRWPQIVLEGSITSVVNPCHNPNATPPLVRNCGSRHDHSNHHATHPTEARLD